ncbi:MAG: type II toxin-antitoxin system RelE/ParE family toxin [Pseudomonadota bacterium]
MPARRTSYVLTKTAERDFREAKRWSLKRWGAKQTRLYFKRLHDVAEYVAKHQPAIPHRDDLSDDESLGVYPVGEHYIVYTSLDASHIAIVALIRQTRDVPAILQANSFRIRRALDAVLKAVKKYGRK